MEDFGYIPPRPRGVLAEVPSAARDFAKESSAIDVPRFEQRDPALCRRCDKPITTKSPTKAGVCSKCAGETTERAPLPSSAAKRGNKAAADSRRATIAAKAERAELARLEEEMKAAQRRSLNARRATLAKTPKVARRAKEKGGRYVDHGRGGGSPRVDTAHLSTMERICAECALPAMATGNLCAPHANEAQRQKRRNGEGLDEIAKQQGAVRRAIEVLEAARAPLVSRPMMAGAARELREAFKIGGTDGEE